MLIDSPTVTPGDRLLSRVVFVVSILLLQPEPAPAESQFAKLRLQVLEDSQPTPARIELQDASGNSFFPEGYYPYRFAFVCNGTAVIEATPGHYRLTVLKGTEHRDYTEEVALEAEKEKNITVEMHRWIDMNDLGWFSGDLHVHRSNKVMPQLLLAEDLNLCAIQSVWNEKSYWKEDPVPEPVVQTVDDRHVFHLLSEEDERDGGAVLLFNLERIIPTPDETRFFPSSLGFIEEALKQGAWIEQEKPFWWEAPVNVALGKVKSTELANNHFNEKGMLDNEAWGRPRDLEKYPGQMGFAQYCFDLYYRFLNAGFRLIPTAGSATGVLPNPLGYNRCYVACGPTFNYDRWFERLSEGRNFVTNGPMLFVEIDGKPLGESLTDQSSHHEVRVLARSRTVIERIEVIGDGEVVAHTTRDPGSEYVEWTTSIASKGVSWIAVRCFEESEATVRFAHTAPMFIGGRESPRKREAAEFFVDWIDELLARTEAAPRRYSSEDKKTELRREYERAREIYARIAEGP